MSPTTPPASAPGPRAGRALAALVLVPLALLAVHLAASPAVVATLAGLALVASLPVLVVAGVVRAGLALHRLGRRRGAKPAGACECRTCTPVGPADVDPAD